MKITKLEKKKTSLLDGVRWTANLLYHGRYHRPFYVVLEIRSLAKRNLIEIQGFAQFSYGKNLALYHYPSRLVLKGSARVSEKVMIFEEKNH